MTDGVRVLSQHDQTLDYHEGIVVPDGARRDATGRPNPHGSIGSWVRVICNNTDCPAEALVSHRAISRLAYAEQP